MDTAIKLDKTQSDGSFVRNQVNQFRDKGWSIIFQKLYTILLMVAAMPIVLIMRVLRSVILVRLKKIEIGRIGAFYVFDWYLSDLRSGMKEKRCFDIFYSVPLHGSVSNHQWLKMWKKVVHFFPFGNFAFAVDRINKYLPGHEAHVIQWNYSSFCKSSVDKSIDEYVSARAKPFLSFTPEEEVSGKRALREVGLPEAAPFVCFHARDSAYLDKVYPDFNWRYHDHRDCSIHSYGNAIEELVKRGYYAVRMGAVVSDKLKVSNPAIIDYAYDGRRTDFLDIYLGANCKFFICDTAGIYIIPSVFRRPIAWVNYIPLGCIHIRHRNDLIIFKKLWLQRERRFLTISEILNSPVAFFSKDRDYEEAGLEVADNTPEEISSLVLEMDERLKGEWQSNEDDEELQERFWLFFGQKDPKRTILSRIGTEFLRQNKELLR